MIKFEGFDELDEATKKMANKLDKGTTKLLREAATECIAETQSRTPVKSGNLKRSWNHGNVTKQGFYKTIKVGSALEYAEAIEDGYKYKNGVVEGRHMLRDSITIAQKELNDKIDSLVSEIMGG